MRISQTNGNHFSLFSAQQFRDEVLDHINASERGIAANPSMSKIFMDRVEKLIEALSGDPTGESINRIIAGMESDFGSIDHYHEAIQILKQEKDKYSGLLS